MFIITAFPGQWHGAVSSLCGKMDKRGGSNPPNPPIRGLGGGKIPAGLTQDKAIWQEKPPGTAGGFSRIVDRSLCHSIVCSAASCSLHTAQRKKNDLA
jgi:hypothetical protein